MTDRLLAIRKYMDAIFKESLWNGNCCLQNPLFVCAMSDHQIDFYIYSHFYCITYVAVVANVCGHICICIAIAVTMQLIMLINIMPCSC